MEDEFFMLEQPTKRWRRKLSHEGSSWMPDQTMSETKDKGLICKNCHRRILWHNLDTWYEMQGTDTYRLWVCECGVVLKEDNMTDLGMVYELEVQDGYEW